MEVGKLFLNVNHSLGFSHGLSKSGKHELSGKNEHIHSLLVLDCE